MTILLTSQVLKFAASDDITLFYNYWNFPDWFLAHFQPAFEKHRKETGGVMLVATFESKPIGTLYCELTPKHVSYGKQVPIFGWVKADSEEICRTLIQTAEQFVIAAGHQLLRGPINPPALYGGWGVLTHNEGVPELAETSPIPEKVGRWIASAGYNSEADYYVLYHARVPNLPVRQTKRNFYQLKLTPQEVLADKEMCAKMKAFIVRAFREYLPDNTTSDIFTEFWEVMASVPGGEAFYQCTMEKGTDEIATLIGHIPNIFQHWRGETITRSNINTMITEKRFRKSHLLHWTNQLSWKKLRKFGIKKSYGAYVWAGNTKALSSFKTWCDIVGTFSVFQKEL